MAEVKLEVKNLTKRFGELVAVDNVSFEVREGEFFSLLGPSGCGKTTTLRCIAGLEIPDEGKIFIKGRDVTMLPPQQRGISLVFQEFAVFPHMSVYDNLAFGLKIRGLPKDEIRRKVLTIAESLHLTDYLGVKAGKLGLSEQQRTALGRSIAVEPEVLLLDEPLTLVDAKVKESMRRELRRLQKELNITILYVTHDQLEAMMMSDRIAVMNAGRILQVGSPMEIYENPKNVFVAKFIGSPTINIVEAKLEKENDMLKIVLNDVKLDIEKKLPKEIGEKYAGKNILMGIRPEDLLIFKEKSSPYDIKCSVDMVELTGNKMELHLKLGETSIRALSTIRFDIEESSEIYLRIHPEKTCIFDRETEERIA